VGAPLISSVEVAEPRYVQAPPASTSMAPLQSMRSFASQGMLQSQASVMQEMGAPVVTAVEVAEPRYTQAPMEPTSYAAQSSLFDMLDRNHDGMLTRDEFNQASMGSMQPGSMRVVQTDVSEMHLPPGSMGALRSQALSTAGSLQGVPSMMTQYGASMVPQSYGGIPGTAQNPFGSDALGASRFSMSSIPSQVDTYREGNLMRDDYNQGFAAAPSVGAMVPATSFASSAGLGGTVIRQQPQSMLSMQPPSTQYGNFPSGFQSAAVVRSLPGTGQTPPTPPLPSGGCRGEHPVAIVA